MKTSPFVGSDIQHNVKIGPVRNDRHAVFRHYRLGMRISQRHCAAQTNNIDQLVHKQLSTRRFRAHLERLSRGSREEAGMRPT